MISQINDIELEKIHAGEIWTVGSVMALMSVLIILVVSFKLYMSNKGKATLGGDYSFEWS